MSVKNILLFMIMALTATAQAQIKPDGGGNGNQEGGRYHARDFCSTYLVDQRVMDNVANLTIIMDSLQGVQPNAYPLMGQWCRQQRARMSRMINSLTNDYTWDGDMVWIDSTHCIVDAREYITRLQTMMPTMLAEAEKYERLEQERIEAERIAAEERARAEALRIQREKDLRLEAMKDSIKDLHKSITSICDARGVTDKARIKELKDLFYAYLAVYNRYDLTSNKTDNARFSQLDELIAFQQEMADSVLGSNSYLQRINDFGTTLKARAGKNHTEVNRSYVKVFKHNQVPITFKSIAEYHEYVGQLRNIMDVQQSYLKAIELRETISQNSNTIQHQCSKKHRDVYAAYKEVLDEMNLVPAYTSLAESRKFIDRLNDFIDLQHAYDDAIKRVDAIESRGDSIILICGKGLHDIALAYKNLIASTDLVPRFINMASAESYNARLDEFERVQQHYITVVGMRKEIDSHRSRIMEAKGTPRAVTSGYKQIEKSTNFTPFFSTNETGQIFIASLNKFMAIQDLFSEVIEENSRIEATTKQLKIAFKNYNGIQRAYNKLMDYCKKEIVILGENDLNSYKNYLDDIEALQKKFTDIADSMEKDDYNHRLKKERDIEKIKLIMGIR